MVTDYSTNSKSTFSNLASSYDYCHCHIKIIITIIVSIVSLTSDLHLISSPSAQTFSLFRLSDRIRPVQLNSRSVDADVTGMNCDVQVWQCCLFWSGPHTYSIRKYLVTIYGKRLGLIICMWILNVRWPDLSDPSHANCTSNCRF